MFSNNEVRRYYNQPDVDLLVGDRAIHKRRPATNFPDIVRFYDEFQGSDDFKNDVKCLLIKPAIQLYLSYKHMYLAQLNLLNAIVQLFTGNFQDSGVALSSAGRSLLYAIYYNIFCKVEIVMQVMSLLLRICNSAIYGIFHHDYLINGVNNRPQQDYLREDQDLNRTFEQMQNEGYASLTQDFEFNKMAHDRRTFNLKVGVTAVRVADDAGFFSTEFKRNFKYDIHNTDNIVCALDRFQSSADFWNDLRCVFLRPAIISYLAAVHFRRAAFKFWIGIVHLITWSPDLALNAFAEGTSSIIKSSMYTIYAAIEIFQQSLSLLSRLLITGADEVQILLGYRERNNLEIINHNVDANGPAISDFTPCSL